ncbi:hypothetical protein GH714_043180 [Hevea brasiliensis]|uniref:ALOG domain-containing protein n=1 Tax=Hevea brasiliensis TaxID=3981 RepID=A0A6A6K132_HEVBR|nr:hypothetical protein GH714_043180 [Hevea brasiliensis]
MDSASGGTGAPDPNSGEPSASPAATGASSSSQGQAEGSFQAPLSRGAHVIEFLKYLDQFGKTKVHITGCPYFGHPSPPAPCACPLKQAWGSLDALIGRLRAAYEENGGKPESNPFGAKAVRIYLREVREGQAKARGIPYEKKKRKRPAAVTAAAVPANISVSVSQGVEIGDGSSSGGGGGDGSGNIGGETSTVIAASTAPAAATTTTAV